MLQLRYSLKRDPHQYATVLGDPLAISNLYWQLTHNYQPQDGMAIGDIKALTMDGRDVTDQVLTNPFGASCPLTTIERS
jgi:hypothetical protein